MIWTALGQCHFRKLFRPKQDQTNEFINSMSAQRHGDKYDMRGFRNRNIGSNKLVSNDFELYYVSVDELCYAEHRRYNNTALIV
jgi:hypothetical protein